MTDGRRTTETVTAEQVYDIGYKRGVEDERGKVLELLSAQEMAAATEDERDALWIVRAIVKSGGHWDGRWGERS